MTTDTFWADFYRDRDAMIAEWREQFDSDGDMDLIELIAEATKHE